MNNRNFTNFGYQDIRFSVQLNYALSLLFTVFYHVLYDRILKGIFIGEKRFVCFVYVLVIIGLGEKEVAAQTFASGYTGFTAVNLGAIPGVPNRYAGPAFKYNDSNKFLVGGGANDIGGAIYEATVIRDAQGHITGFNTATKVANAPDPNNGSIDAGLMYGPNNVLFYVTFASGIGNAAGYGAYLGQILPGGTGPAKLINLAALPNWQFYDPWIPLGLGDANGYYDATGSLTIVPPGFPGAGGFKIMSWENGVVYDATLTPDGTGTYNVSLINRVQLGPTVALDHGVNSGQDIQGMVYVKGGCNAAFPTNTVLMPSFDNNAIYAYDIDGLGNPIRSTKRSFLTNMPQYPSGVVIDPVTGDFLFVNWLSTGSSVVRVSGVTCPSCTAGTTAPTLSATTIQNVCPALTVNLSGITSSNLPSGTVLTWHTATPATDANKISNITALATGATYYAAFWDQTNNCYSGTGSATTAVTATAVVCVTCNAGAVAPTLSASTIQNICPALTVDLSGITSSNLPSGTVLTWHTATPATDANKISNITALATGATYYAAFWDQTNNCYSGTGSATTAVTATAVTCVTCNAGSAAPVVSASTIQNVCPALTVDLSSITSSNLPSGTVLTWHTATPATDANKISNITALATGATYYAAFWDQTNNCYSGTGSATTAVTATAVTCVTCNAGSTAPVVSASTIQNTCPALTVDLSSITSSSLPAGTVLTWHTATPATDANKISNITALATGATYYAAFWDQTNNCYSGTGSATTAVTATAVVCNNPPAGVIDCAKTWIVPAPVAGTASQVDLIVTVNVSVAGTFTPLTVSGSGMSLANGITSVSTTTTGIQTFHIPLNYDGSALGTLSFTIGSAGSCTADLTKPPKKSITDIWTLECIPMVGPSLR